MPFGFVPGQVLTAAQLNGLLSSASGNIGGDVPLGTNTVTKIMSTASLAVGTWWVHMHATIQAPSDAGNMGIWVVTETATATFSGCLAAGGGNVSGQALAFTISFFAVVTVAGTLKMNGEYTNSGGANAKSLSALGSTSATGYTAIKIA